ncbi:MAG TPA: DNA polymerase III subunit delta' C-terminal domain-containing protein [Clostridia bacterium]
MGLNKLIGQKMLVFQLKKILSDRKLGHAYAFSGPEGMGKRTFALEFAAEILCPFGRTNGCGCISCRTFAEGTNPDFYEVASDKSSIGIDVIRALQEHAANRPAYGNKKVYFIDGADTMTVQAQNCLLKTLEEPPEYVVIILSAVNYDALLPTIRSRTVNLRMEPYSEDEIREIIKPLQPKRKEELDFYIRFSRGIPGNAVRMLEEGSFRDLRLQIIKFLQKPDDFSQIEKTRRILTENKDELPAVIDIIMSVYRDCLMVLTGMENGLINSDKKDIIKEIALSCSKRKLMNRLSALENMQRNFRYNINYQLGIDVLLLEIQEV